MMEFGVSVPHGKPGMYTDWKMIREAALKCERLGFDSLYVSDHMVPRPNTPYPEKDVYDLDVPYYECWTVLSALAVETSRVKLGTFTLCNSFRQPPSLLAKMATTVDHLSGGRLILGMGAGYNEQEYVMYGVPYPKKATRLRMMEEALRIIKLMWTEDRPSYEGRYYHIHEAICNPKPLQKPYPPIMIGGRGKRITMKIVARHADRWNWPPAVPCTPEVYGEYCEILRKNCEAEGRDPDGIVKSLGDICHISRDGSELKSEVVKFKPDELTMDEYMFHLIGSPEECIEKISVYRDLGISELVLQFPSLGAGETKDVELFAETVIPAFKGS